MENPTYSSPTQNDHNNTPDLLHELIEVDGVKMKIIKYINALKNGMCGE